MMPCIQVLTGNHKLRPFRIVLNYETLCQLRLLARCLLIYAPDFVYSVFIITEHTITEHQGRIKQSQQIRVTPGQSRSTSAVKC
jgi:hypothetical protein